MNKCIALECIRRDSYPFDSIAFVTWWQLFISLYPTAFEWLKQKSPRLHHSSARTEFTIIPLNRHLRKRKHANMSLNWSPSSLFAPQCTVKALTDESTFWIDPDKCGALAQTTFRVDPVRAEAQHTTGCLQTHCGQISFGWQEENLCQVHLFNPELSALIISPTLTHVLRGEDGSFVSYFQPKAWMLMSPTWLTLNRQIAMTSFTVHLAFTWQGHVCALAQVPTENGIDFWIILDIFLLAWILSCFIFTLH